MIQNSFAGDPEVRSGLGIGLRVRTRGGSKHDKYREKSSGLLRLHIISETVNKLALDGCSLIYGVAGLDNSAGVDAPLPVSNGFGDEIAVELA
jgi:hypothetical protein